MWAATRGYTRVVYCLLSLGARVDSRDSDEATPLFYAAARGKSQVVSELLKAGADPKAKDRRGVTALCAATMYAGGDLRSMDLLIASQQDRRAAASLALVCLDESYRRAEKARFLIDRGADPNSRNRRGESVLMQYARYGYSDVVEVLLGTQQLDPNAGGASGKTPLMEAAAEGHYDTVKLLLRMGADPCIQDESGKTAADMANKRAAENYMGRAESLKKIAELLESSR